jgi:ABC-type dipeptide/oligopeptide/nickel transport system permease subunit
VLTFFVTLIVVVLAIAGAIAVAISDPNQPATLRPRPGRIKRPAWPRKVAAPKPVRQPAVTRVITTAAPQEMGGGSLSEQWVPVAGGSTGTNVWIRLRSGVMLTMLLTVVGALVALSVAGVVVLIALAIRSAVS